MTNKQVLLSSPHRHSGISVQLMMLRVLLALLPALLVYAWIFGWGIFIQCGMAVAFALLLEYLVLRIRHRPWKLFMFDGSAPVTAVLLVLCPVSST